MDSFSIEDFRRLEAKVDKLHDAISKLILFEERQATQGERLGQCEFKIIALEARQTSIDAKVEKWINRGIGAWAVAVFVFAILEFGANWYSK
jgi:hypothetical protein